MAKLKTPKQPKLLKYKRKPKASASLVTLENYLRHVKETDANNKKRLSEWQAEKKRVDAANKKAESLRKQVASISGKRK